MNEKAEKALRKIRKIVEMIDEDPTDPLVHALAELLLGNAVDLVAETRK